MERKRSYSLRPAKRVRPALVVAGYSLARGSLKVPSGLWRFAAGLEFLHTFLLIHDDVADQAGLRQGGAALHCLLGPGRAGEDLAVEVEVYCNGLLLTLLREMGLRLDIAREHLASALIRQRFRAMLDAEAERADGLRVVLACPAQHHHEGGTAGAGASAQAKGLARHDARR
jgi:geranylgeranyl pyrophosphate synthase